MTSPSHNSTVSEPIAASLGGVGTESTAVLLALTMILFLALRAFYAGSETALVSADLAKVRGEAARGSRKAQIVKDLMGWPEGMLAMTLVGTNLTSVIVSQIGLALMTLLVVGEEAAALSATVLTTTVVLIFGEILPKTIARANSNVLAMRFAYPLWWSRTVFAIPVQMMTRLTGLLAERLGRDATPATAQMVRSELHLMATLGEESGGLARDQRQMIHGVLELGNRTLGHAMTPLVEMVAVEKNTDLETLLVLAAETGYSRIPVFDRRIYNIVGIVHVLDVVHMEGEATSIEQLMRTQIRFSSESTHIVALLRQIQESSDTMVFAVDEYGGTVGLATVEDLVEEVVGEMADERDIDETIRLINPRKIECEGRAEIDELIDRYAVPLSRSATYETIAGLILESTNEIPGPGDEIVIDELAITVLEAHPRGITKVRIASLGPEFGETASSPPGMPGSA